MPAWVMAILFIIIMLLVGAWYYFRHLGEKHGYSTLQAIRIFWRRDLDYAPITVPLLNFIYRSRMRGTGKKGPNGKVMPIPEIVVEMPEEDYLFVESWGIDAYAEQLAEYRHKYALGHHWYEAGDDSVPVRILRNNSLRRLRPWVRYTTTHDGKTHVLNSDPAGTRRLGANDAARTAEPVGTRRMDSDAPGGTRPVDTADFKDERIEGRETPTERLSYLRCKGQEWTLVPSQSPYRFGRAESNDIHVADDVVSSYHANIAYSEGSWVIEPMKTTNKTKLDGRAIEQPTALASGTVITIGSFGPMVFQQG